jgi:transposase-like protein
LKARVALAALQGQRTVVEIAVHYQVQPEEVLRWKNVLFRRVAGLFDTTSGRIRREKKKAPNRARKAIRSSWSDIF